MKIEHYDRSWQQNEEMGLNDMKVEGYEAEAAGASNDAAKHREDAKPNSAEALGRMNDWCHIKCLFLHNFMFCVLFS